MGFFKCVRKMKIVADSPSPGVGWVQSRLTGIRGGADGDHDGDHSSCHHQAWLVSQAM